MLLKARRLVDLSITSQWTLPGTGWFRSFFSESMNLVMLSRHVNGFQAVVFEPGQSKPVLELEGEPLALSPDGRHAVIENNKHLLVISVDTGERVAEFKGNGQFI